MSSEKRSKRGPESVYLDTLKGEQIEVTFSDGRTLYGRLLWVDVYTFGVLQKEHAIGTIRPSKPKEILVYKTHVQTLCLESE